MQGLISTKNLPLFHSITYAKCHDNDNLGIFRRFRAIRSGEPFECSGGITLVL